MTDVAPAEASELRHLYLIDGSGFIFRAFHALPPLTRSDGTPVNAVLGFSNMLWKISARDRCGPRCGDLRHRAAHLPQRNL